MKDKVFAVVGDVHDHFDRMVGLVEAAARQCDARPSFVLQVGDFQANRHEDDLRTMAAPGKYRKLGDFGKYWSGKAQFPWPVYFIGGNHEPYGWLEQHPDGASLIDNCHYIGRVGRLGLCGLSIVGLSGIHVENKENQDRPGPHEFGKRANKDFTHYTDSDIERAASLGPADILVVHDWPVGLVREADVSDLFKNKRPERFSEIGSARSRALVDLLSPRLVVCGHMHLAHRSEIPLTSGGVADTHCLANVGQGQESVAIFSIPTLQRLV